MKKYYPLLFILFLIFVSSCATIQPGYETPVVNITSFEAIPSQGMIPQFQINLHIINPNRTLLDLKGISYTIFLEDHKIMTGVSNKLPSIEAYGEGDVLLKASVDLFGSIKFFTDLMGNPKKDHISYRFNAKLDAGGLHPLIRASRKGLISFKQAIQDQ